MLTEKCTPRRPAGTAAVRSTTATLGRIVLALAALAALLVSATPAHAVQPLTKRSAERKLRSAIRTRSPGATAIKVSCAKPRRGRTRCGVRFTAAGKSCSDRRVTVIRRKGRVTVANLRAECSTPAAPPAQTTGAAPSPPATTQQPQEDAPPQYKAAIGCSNGAVNPPDCTVFGGPTGPITEGNCLGTDGRLHLTLYFFYSNGSEYFRRADLCNTWYDAEWSQAFFYQGDYDFWGNQTFGPAVYCDYHRGGICG